MSRVGVRKQVGVMGGRNGWRGVGGCGANTDGRDGDTAGRFEAVSGRGEG